VAAGVRSGEVPPVPKPLLSDIVITNSVLSPKGRVVENEVVASVGIEMFTGTLNFGVRNKENGGSPPFQLIVNSPHAFG